MSSGYDIFWPGSPIMAALPTQLELQLVAGTLTKFRALERGGKKVHPFIRGILNHKISAREPADARMHVGWHRGLTKGYLQSPYYCYMPLLPA